MPKKSLILIATLALTALLGGCGTNYNQIIEYSTLGLQNPENSKNHATMLSIRAEALRNQGHFEAALKDHNQALLLDAKMPFHRQARAETYKAMGRFQEAQADFEKSTELEAAWQAEQASKLP